jgi:hypothetical protein
MGFKFFCGYDLSDDLEFLSDERYPMLGKRAREFQKKWGVE